MNRNITNLNNDNIEYLNNLYNIYVNSFRDREYLNNDDPNWCTVTRMLQVIDEDIKCSSVQNSIKYWIYRGYTKEVAILKVTTFQSKTSLDKFIERHGEIVGTEKYNNYIKNVSERGKLYQAEHGPSLAYSKTIDPDTGEYYTPEKALERSRQDAHRGGTKAAEMYKKGEILSIYQPQFWINKGYSTEEAADIIYSKMAHNGIEYYVEKYGIEDGTRRYEERIEKFKNTWNSKSNEELADIYFRRTKAVHRVSKASQDFFNKCIEILKEHGVTLNKIYMGDNEFHLYDRENCAHYFYNYCDLENKIMVEYNGFKYHPYKDVLGDDLVEWRCLFYGIDGVTQRNKDIRKEEFAKQNGFTFLTVWDIEGVEFSMKNFLKLYNIEI